MSMHPTGQRTMLCAQLRDVVRCVVYCYDRGLFCEQLVKRVVCVGDCWFNSVHFVGIFSFFHRLSFFVHAGTFGVQKFCL